MTELASISIVNGSGIADEDQSVFRSGGQLKEYPPRPRIATARPRETELRHSPETQETTDSPASPEQAVAPDGSAG